MDNELILAMIDYEEGCPERVQHFLKVHSFSKLIGEQEHVDDSTMHILLAAAIVHDIGIAKAIEKYGSSNGKYQEELGPDIARSMLSELGYEKNLIDRVCYLVGHHHTYTDIDGIDYQILVEADFLVNIYEGNMQAEAIQSVFNNIFKTNTGLKIGKTMFQ